MGEYIWQASNSSYYTFPSRVKTVIFFYNTDHTQKTIILIIPMTRPFGNVAISSQTLLAEKLPSQKNVLSEIERTTSTPLTGRTQQAESRKTAFLGT